MKLRLLAIYLVASGLDAAEQSVSGLVDVRAIHTYGMDSYVEAGLGKFRFNPGTDLALAQAGLGYRIEWENQLSLNLITNGYLDGVDNSLGVTEAYLDYHGVPSESGFRLDARGGIIYPQISLENVATAWSSPYTLSYSTLNAWVGEEVRHLGARFSLTHLGKFRQSAHDFTLSAELFGNNDTSGAMLAWHGWTQSSRQTLWHETLPIADIPAMNGGALRFQARRSDPFLELDDRLGGHVHAQWHWQGQGKLQLGYYDNNADVRVVKHGQYAWGTRFGHLGVKWRLPLELELIGQYLQGNTLMRSPRGLDVVNNDFASAFVLLSRRWDGHRWTLRLEDFEVKDKDNLPGDDNSEDGQAYTLSYGYKLSKGWYLQAEYNLVDASRPARLYLGEKADKLEQQLQLASRYYF